MKILFLCAGNSCRSQMAEGWARQLFQNDVEAFSAGAEKRQLDPRAIEVMREAGIDISRQYSKTVNELQEESFDFVVTLCDESSESCPVFLGKGKRIHHPFDDLPILTQGMPESQALSHYRRVRDEIREFLVQLFNTGGG